MLLNGTRITTPVFGTLMSGTELPIEAIQRVEVIRVPGSALYGADAFAGLLSYHLQKNAKDINGTVLGARAEIIALRADGDSMGAQMGRLGVGDQSAISAYQWR